jgi:sphingomyelin phosphodiesterase 2
VGQERDAVDRLTVASFNTRGIPVVGSRLAKRYAVIGADFDASEVDVACLQEVFTYWHLALLTRRMRSFVRVSYQPSAIGPAGGLVTFSRLPVTETDYHGFGVPPAAPGVSRLARLRSGLKGVLVTRLAKTGLTVINTHPMPNRDGDWSEANRFRPLHHSQLSSLAGVVRGVSGPSVVCGDFNVDRESSLMAGFLRGTGLSDAFEGGCPATFRPEYLPAGKIPCCIDFILASNGVKAEAATVLFTAKAALPGGLAYVSDHLGLRASLFTVRG